MGLMTSYTGTEVSLVGTPWVAHPAKSKTAAANKSRVIRGDFMCFTKGYFWPFAKRKACA